MIIYMHKVLTEGECKITRECSVDRIGEYFYTISKIPMYYNKVVEVTEETELTGMITYNGNTTRYFIDDAPIVYELVIDTYSFDDVYNDDTWSLYPTKATLAYSISFDDDIFEAGHETYIVSYPREIVELDDAKENIRILSKNDITKIKTEHLKAFKCEDRERLYDDLEKFIDPHALDMIKQNEPGYLIIEWDDYGEIANVSYYTAETHIKYDTKVIFLTEMISRNSDHINTIMSGSVDVFDMPDMETYACIQKGSSSLSERYKSYAVGKIMEELNHNINNYVVCRW